MGNTKLQRYTLSQLGSRVEGASIKEFRVSELGPRVSEFMHGRSFKFEMHACRSYMLGWVPAHPLW